MNTALVLFLHIADCLEADKPQITPKDTAVISLFSIAALFALLLI